MLASNGTLATAGSRLSVYGGDGGVSAWRYELMRCTKVVLPEPAMPMVMITTGFLGGAAPVEADDEEAMVCGAREDAYGGAQLYR